MALLAWGSLQRALIASLPSLEGKTPRPIRSFVRGFRRARERRSTSAFAEFPRRLPAHLEMEQPH
jgi:hypothetical protein